MGTNGHVPELLDAATVKRSDGTTSLYLVMDLYPTDLADFLKNCPRSNLTEQKVIKILYTLLCGMNYLDSAGILHRDLKP